MCRIKPVALNKTESVGAADRARVAEDRLISSIIRFQRYAITRRGGDQNRKLSSPEAREKMRVAIVRLTHYASGP